MSSQNMPNYEHFYGKVHAASEGLTVGLDGKTLQSEPASEDGLERAFDHRVFLQGESEELDKMVDTVEALRAAGALSGEDIKTLKTIAAIAFCKTATFELTSEPYEEGVNFND